MARTVAERQSMGYGGVDLGLLAAVEDQNVVSRPTHSMQCRVVEAYLPIGYPVIGAAFAPEVWRRIVN